MARNQNEVKNKAAQPPQPGEVRAAGESGLPNTMALPTAGVTNRAEEMLLNGEPNPHTDVLPGYVGGGAAQQTRDALERGLRGEATPTGPDAPGGHAGTVTPAVGPGTEVAGETR